MGIQGNGNSFFTCYFKIAPDRFFWNLEFAPDDSILHYWDILIFKFIIPQIHYADLIKNLGWDIFTTWILKHGVMNPFKHGVHYMN